MSTLLYNILSNLKHISLHDSANISVASRKETKYTCQSFNTILTLLYILNDWYVLTIDDNNIFTYKTTYYDTTDLKMYIDQCSKKQYRQKIRIREYSNGTKYLEIKERKHNITNKYRKEIFTNELDIHWLKENSLYDISDICKSSKTIYNRITLVSPKKDTRITIDFNLQYINYFTSNTISKSDIILEVKSKENSIDNILKRLHFKEVKYSKYKHSIELTD